MDKPTRAQLKILLEGKRSKTFQCWVAHMPKDIGDNSSVVVWIPNHGQKPGEAVGVVCLLKASHIFEVKRCNRLKRGEMRTIRLNANGHAHIYRRVIVFLPGQIHLSVVCITP